jgi:hypothetical protein
MTRRVATLRVSQKISHNLSGIELTPIIEFNLQIVRTLAAIVPIFNTNLERLQFQNEE